VLGLQGCATLPGCPWVIGFGVYIIFNVEIKEDPETV
jgi:hypothetical protein